MIWFKKSEGIKVVVNHPINLRNPSPGFTDLFAAEARRQGKSVEFWNKKNADLVLLIGKSKNPERMEHFKKQGAKFVQRLDGIGVKDPKNPFASINYQTHQEVNAAIFQSRFCLEVWEKTFGVGKPSCIVLNGADEKVFSREGKKNDFGFKRLMVTAARWREWKNLDQVIEVFEALDDKDLGLAVIGEGAEVPKHPRILAPGRLSHRRMAEVFRAADLFIYLPWYEWCPKVVAQALVTGLPVLCSYNGGTRELVRDCGRAVRGEKDAGLEYFYRNPVDLKEAVKAAGELLEKHERVKPRPDLYASKMVEGYFKVFEQALENARP